MAVDLKKTIARIKREKTERGRVVLYLDKPLLKRFQAVCKSHGVSASIVIEEVIRDFVDGEK